MRNIIMVLDTETIGLDGPVYDVGYTITTTKGDILQERNWLVDEVFTDGKRMKHAFYASKMFTHYARMLQDGLIRIKSWKEIVFNMQADFYAFNVNVITAYNLAFDRRVMKSTHKMLGWDTPILAPARQLDLWRFACQTKLNSKTYKKLAIEQGWISKKGNLHTNAECAYRYIMGKWDFIENHTALSDARIETEILASCYAAHKAIPYNVVNGTAWKIVNS